MNRAAIEATRQAQLGVPVFPLGDRSKEPRTPHGFMDATTGLRQIDEWARRWPNANWAARTGVQYDALDVDGDNGFATLATIVAAHGAINAGGIVATPGKVRDGAHRGPGAHYLFAVTGLRYTDFGGNVEMKAAGGYVLLPGSEHPDGGFYEWVQRLDALDQLPAAPAWVYVPAREREERRRRELAEREARRAERPVWDRESPMERFNRTAEWSEILEPYGWRYSHESGENAYWVRPGKTIREGHSASVNDDAMYVFSNDAPPFEAGQAYSKFRAWSLLRFAGDDSTAARTLIAWWRQQEAS